MKTGQKFYKTGSRDSDVMGSNRDDYSTTNGFYSPSV